MERLIYENTIKFNNKYALVVNCSICHNWFLFNKKLWFQKMLIITISLVSFRDLRIIHFNADDINRSIQYNTCANTGVFCNEKNNFIIKEVKI